MATERVGRAVLEFSTDSRQFNTDVDKAGQKIVDLKKKAGDTSTTFATLSGDLGKVSKGFSDLGGSVGPLGPALGKVQGAIAGVASGVTALGPAGAVAAVGIAAVTAGALAAAAAVGAIGAVVVSAVRSAADLGDEFLNMSNKTGLSVEALSKFKFIAQQTDTEVDTIIKTVQKLGQNLAAGSKETVAAIGAIGLSVADIRKMKPEEAFTTILTAIGKLPDAGQRAAAGAAIFGKQFREIAQLTQEDLKGLSQQAQDLGVVFSTEFAVAGDRFNDAIGAIRSAVQGATAQLGTAFLPVATVFIETFEREFVRALNAGGASAGNFATTVADAALVVGQAFAGIVVAGGIAARFLNEFFAGKFIASLGLLDLFAKVLDSLSSILSIGATFNGLLAAPAALAAQAAAGIHAFTLETGLGFAKASAQINTYADAVTLAAARTGAELPASVAKLKAEITAQADVMRKAQADAGGFGNALEGLGDEHAKAEKAAKAHREELEKLDNWLASKGVLTTTGYSNVLGDLIAKLNLAAREGTPTLQAALKVLAPEFERVSAAAKASGQDVSVVNGIFRDFLQLAGDDQVATQMADWERANIATAGSLDAILAKLPTVSVQTEGLALSARIATDAYHTFGLKTPAELQKAADAARFAYQQIVNAVGAKAPEAIAAHAKMVEAINAASGKIPSYWQTTVFPGIRDVLGHIQTAVSGSFSAMLLGAKSFKDGFIDIWKSIKAGVLNILASIADAFLNSFLKGILGAMSGQQGAFGAAFAGLFGGGKGGGLLGNLAGLLGGAGGAGAAAGGIGGGVTMVGTGAGGVMVPIGMTGTAAGAGGTAAGGGLMAGASGALLGGAAAAGGGALLGLLGKQIFGGSGWKAGTFGAGTGAATGALIGSVVPVLGTAIGALVGGLAGLFSGWLGKTQSQKVNDARDQVTAKFGGTGTGAGSGFANLAAELQKATGSGALFERFLKASTMKDFEAATKAVTEALSSQAYTTLKVKEASDDLTKQREAAVAAGQSEDEAIRAQAGSYSDLLQTIKTTGATAPEAMQPILLKLMDMGLLVDATGQKLTDLSGINFADAAGNIHQVTAAVLQATRAAEQAQTAYEDLKKKVADQFADIDKQEAALNASEAPEAVMGVIETQQRAQFAAQRAALEEQLKVAAEAAKAAADAVAKTQTDAAAAAAAGVGKSIDETGDRFVHLGDVAEEQAKRAREALSTIGHDIPSITIPYHYSQDGPDLPAGADVRGLSTGGLVTRYLATGGLVRQASGLAAAAVLATAPLYAATGTFVPRGTDTVPAMLTPGEFVIPQSTVSALGADFFRTLVTGGLPPLTLHVGAEASQALAVIQALGGVALKPVVLPVATDVDAATREFDDWLERVPTTLPVTIDTDNTQLLAATKTVDAIPDVHALNIAVQAPTLAAAVGDIQAIPATKALTIAAAATGLAGITQDVKAIPDRKALSVVAQSIGVHEVVREIGGIPTRKELAVLAQAVGVREVVASISSIPDRKIVQVIATAVGVPEVLAALERIPATRAVAVPVRAFGIPEVLRGLATIPPERPVQVGVFATGIAGVLQALQTIPSVISVDLQLPSPATMAARANAAVDAVLGALARLPAAISIGLTPTTGRTPAPGTWQSPLPYPGPGTWQSPMPYPDNFPTPLPYPGPISGPVSGGSFKTPSAGGGFGTGSGSGGSFHLALGGLVPTVYAGTGVFVPRGTDTVPAMLTPGEYVVPKLTVDRLGVGFLQSLSSAPLPTIQPKPPGTDVALLASLHGLEQSLARLERVVAAHETVLQLDGKEIARAPSFLREHVNSVRTNRDGYRTDHRDALGVR